MTRRTFWRTVAGGWLAARAVPTVATAAPAVVHGYPGGCACSWLSTTWEPCSRGQFDEAVLQRHQLRHMVAGLERGHA